MKTIIKTAVLCLLVGVFCLLSVSVYAEDLALDEQFLAETQDSLEDAVNEDARKFLSNNNVSLSTTDRTADITFEKVIRAIWDTMTFGFGRAVRLFAMLLAVILVCTLSEGLSADKNSTSTVLNLIGVLTAVGVMFTQISSTMSYVMQTVEDSGRFMLAFVPIFASTVGASGSVTTASGYYVTLMTVAELATAVATNLLMPSLSILLAMSITESINPSISLSGFTSGIKKAVQWAIGLIMTIFVGVISIQSIAGVSADTVATKTAKFAISSFVPIVGSAVSEAYTTVRGSLGLIRTGVGTFGVVAILAMIIPPLVQVINLKLSISVAGVVSEMLGGGKITSLLKNTSNVLTLAMSIMICIALMLIISTTVLMLVCLNL